MGSDDAWTTAIDSLTYEAPTITVESAPYAAAFENMRELATRRPGAGHAKDFVCDRKADWMPIAVNGNFETFTPWPSWHLIDVNGDGFADLVTSIRGGVVALEFDCAGKPRVPGGV